MELIQETEAKATYEKCKYKVKLWEQEFKTKHGRLPSKHDIREADKEVRAAYRTYFHLKLKALEDSFADIDGFNSDDEVNSSHNSTVNVELGTNEPEVCKEKENIVNQNVIDTSFKSINNCDIAINTNKTWGEHLNCKQKKIEEDNVGTSFNSKITEKLFCGSKLSKRKPRKSLSFSQKKKDSNISKPVFLSQPSPSKPTDTVPDNITLDFNDMLSNFEPDLTVYKEDIVKFCPAKERVASKPLDIQALKSKEIRNIDTNWLNRVQISLGTKAADECDISNSNKQTELDDDSDVVYSSGDENTTCSIVHIKKKQKLSIESNISQVPIGSCISETKKRLDFSNIFGKKTEESMRESPTKDQHSVMNKEGMRAKATKKTKAKPKVDDAKQTSAQRRTSGRSRKARVELTYSSESEPDPYHSDGNDSDDPLFNSRQQLDKRKVSPLISSDSKPKSKTKNQDSIKRTVKSSHRPAECETETDNYELEYSVKPRIKSVPRIKHIKQLISNKDKVVTTSKDSTKVKDKKEQMEEKLEKKLLSGTANENFVTINLKKKIFVRGKKSVNFSKYKKQQWKNKKKALCGPDMDMGGCDGGQLTCFKCGEIGHFARHCKTIQGDSLLPNTVDEEEYVLPTLEEATKMAQESTLAIRKPKINANNDEVAGRSLEKEYTFSDEDDEELLAETLKLEARFDMHQYLDSTNTVKPVYGLNEDGSIVDTPKEVFDVLSKFGHSSFRPGQEKAIMRILSAKSTLVTLSTGSGKSLCYQIPAYLYSLRQPCITLVISPLVSLMEDQVVGIPSFLKAACLHTNQTKVQRQKILDAIESGGLDILLVSPEAVVAGEKASGFGSLLRKLPPIAFACIDEVHCVSQWSHNFRPSYLMICRVLHDRLGVTTILGLTATATKSTCESIMQHLKIPDGEEGVIQDIPLPRNLHLSVSKEVQRDRALLELLLSDRFAELKSIIVYCTRRDECERVAAYLRTCLNHTAALKDGSRKRKRVDVQAEPYHAGLSASRRKTIQKAFMSGELRIVVATVAFGMGINKSDIRAVVHYNMPSSFESYVQEIGRAGRDGLPAYCHLFLDSQGKDNNELRRHIYADSIDRHVIRKLLQKIFISCSCEKVCPRHEVAFSIQETVQALDIPEENISTLLCYLELHKNRYIEVLSPGYVNCKIISYGGPQQIQKAAKECPPLAMALILYRDNIDKKSNVMEFPVIDVASHMGWDSGICKHILKNLEWTSDKNQPKRSLLTVQFSNLGFRMLAPGNLTPVQLDEALDSLHEHVVNQECMSLLQLHALHLAVSKVVQKTFKDCLEQESCSEQLKSKILEYFESPNPLDNLPAIKECEVNEEQIAADVRALVCMYRDNTFTGRAVARIFYGIQSPNYPAVIWGRCKFWRMHMNTDFHAVCKIATKEILRMKQ